MPTVNAPRFRHLLVLLLAAVAPLAVAQDAIRSEPVTLTAGEPRVITDTLGGFETVLYKIPLRSAESLSVALASSNLSNCFEIFAPGTAKPFYLSELHGNRHDFRATAAGEYTVKVFLLRLAARDYQFAQYDLTLTLNMTPESPLPSGQADH
jgi:hypothetical protein